MSREMADGRARGKGMLTWRKGQLPGLAKLLNYAVGGEGPARATIMMDLVVMC